jgi:Flp pilus assembly protein TadG
MELAFLISINRHLASIESLLRILIQKEQQMSQATDNLAKAVQRETDVTTSVTTLISGLAAQIKAASSDPQVQGLADQINQNSDALAAAVTANTPAAPDAGALGA